MDDEINFLDNQRNRKLITILSKALDIVDLIVDSRRKDNIYISFDAEDEKQNLQTDKLFDFLFRRDSDSLKTLFFYDCKKEQKLDLSDYRLINVMNLFNIGEKINGCNPPKLTTPPMSDDHTLKLEEFIKNLKNSFVMDEKKSLLMEKLKNFFHLRKTLSKCKNPFIEKERIEEYLQCYYDILLFLLLNENVLNEHELIYSPQNGLLYILLQLDVEEKSVSFFSPMALNNIRKMYLLVESYYEKIQQDDRSNLAIRFMEKRVIIEKALHMFRWFFYDASGELIHAAVSPYDCDEEKRVEMKLPCRKITDCSSYEAIYELRTAEKILYELKNWIFSGACDIEDSSFQVVLVGDLNEEPLKELCRYIEKVISRTVENEEKLKKRITIELYSKTFLDMSGAGEWNYIREINYQGDQDSVFNRAKLENLMKEKNVIFLLDCVKLYNPMSYSLELSPEYYKQRMANSSFSTWLLDKNIDYCNLNCLNELYNCMNIYMNYRHLGKYVKMANEALVSFCQNFYKKTADQKKSTLYIYVSDLKAFSQLYNDDTYYMRTERYNQKEIGIIRFTNFEKEEEIQDEHPDMLTFNLWQMVKHICIKEREEFIELLRDEEFVDSSVNEEDLQSMHIGIDYSDWKNEMLLHYYVDENTRGIVEAPKLLQSLIVPILKNEDDLFQKYFQRAVYSFLYGNAITFDDMLFIYLYYNKRNLLGEVKIAAVNDSERVKANINTKYKYSIKRFVEESISKLDFDGFNVDDKYLIAGQGKEELKKIYKNLRESCEHLEYLDSCLYKNSKDEG